MNTRTMVVTGFVMLATACTRKESITTITANEDGFSPSSVTVAKGRPAAIAFTRTTDATCAREVVFPDLGIRKDLPLDTPVVISLPANEGRTYAFECGMAMYKGSVVVQ